VRHANVPERIAEWRVGETAEAFLTITGSPSRGFTSSTISVPRHA